MSCSCLAASPIILTSFAERDTSVDYADTFHWWTELERHCHALFMASWGWHPNKLVYCTYWWILQILSKQKSAMSHHLCLVFFIPWLSSSNWLLPMWRLCSDCVQWVAFWVLQRRRLRMKSLWQVIRSLTSNVFCHPTIEFSYKLTGCHTLEYPEWTAHCQRGL